MTKRTCWIAGLIVFAAAFVYFASYIEYGLAYDEGYLLDGVEKLMEGQVIYRDFHHTYAPGRFYVVAAAFKIFGKNILVERFIFVFLQALKCALAFLVVVTITGSWLALLAPVLIMIAPGPWHKVFFSSLGFLATYAMMVSIRKSPRWLLPAGVIVGLCAVFRQDAAGFAAIGGLIGMAVGLFAQPVASRLPSGRSRPAGPTEGAVGLLKKPLPANMSARKQSPQTDERDPSRRRMSEAEPSSPAKRDGMGTPDGIILSRKGHFFNSPTFSAFVRRVLYLACGIAIVLIPVLLYFHAEGALGPMVHKIAVDGMIDNMTNRIPYPALTAKAPVDSEYLAHVLPVRLLFYLPFVAYAASLLIMVRQALLRRWSTGMTSFAVLLAVSIMAFNQSVWRSDLGHLLQTMQYVFLLVPVLVSFAYRSVESKWGAGTHRVFVPKLVLALIAPAFLVWASIGIVSATTERTAIARFQREQISIGDTEYLGSIAVRAGNTAKLGLERAPVFVTPGEAGFFTAVGRFLDTHTKPGDYVLAVPQLQMVYFFYDRRNPTAYAHYRRALDREEEDRYIEDIGTHQTEYILLTEPFKGARLGQTKLSFSEYAERVRDWIFDNYEVVDVISSVKILRRKT